MKGEMLVYITLQESVLPSGDVARDLVFLYSITMADTVSAVIQGVHENWLLC